MQIALWGYYGPNYGDNIMLKVLLDYFNKKNINIFLIQQFDDSLEYKLKEHNIKYNNVTVIPFNNYSRKEKLKTIKKLAKVKINIWGGGTIFTDSDGDGNYRFFKLIKFFGGKIGYMGVGIGKLSDPIRIKRTKKLLTWSSLTVFRDDISYERANNLVYKKDYLMSEDLSYIFLHNYKEFQGEKDDKYVLLTWRNLKGSLPHRQELQLMEDTVGVIKNILNNNHLKKVKLVALDTEHDIDSCRIINKILKDNSIEVEFDIDSSISNITNLISNAHIHFSGRLHGSVVSEYFGVSTVALSYSPKMEYFYKSINCTNYIDIYSQNINIKNVEKILRNKSSEINSDEKLEEANLNFDYLEDFLRNNE